MHQIQKPNLKTELFIFEMPENYPRCWTACSRSRLHASHRFVLHPNIPNFDSAVPWSGGNFRSAFADSKAADAVDAVNNGLVSFYFEHGPTR